MIIKIVLIVFVVFSIYQYSRAESNEIYKQLCNSYREDIQFWSKYCKKLEKEIQDKAK